MMSSLKSEVRKLLSVRSTCVIILISLLIIALLAGFGDGFRASPASLQSTGLLASESANAVVFIGLIFAFAGLLLLGHEYRYNTLIYTFTSSPSRLRSFIAKILAVSSFAVLTSLLATFFSPLCTILGAHLHGYQIGPQHFDYWHVIWRCIFVGWGYAMYAFILIAILRSQVGAIVTFLLVPLIGENIIGHVFSNVAKYLPFTALQSVLQEGGDRLVSLSVGHSALVALAYIVAGLAVSVVLFARRDAL